MPRLPGEFHMISKCDRESPNQVLRSQASFQTISLSARAARNCSRPRLRSFRQFRTIGEDKGVEGKGGGVEGGEKEGRGEGKRDDGGGGGLVWCFFLRCHGSGADLFSAHSGAQSRKCLKLVLCSEFRHFESNIAK